MIETRIHCRTCDTSEVVDPSDTLPHGWICLYRRWEDATVVDVHFCRWDCHDAWTAHWQLKESVLVGVASD